MILIIAVTVVMAFLIYASASIGAGVYLKATCRIPTTAREVVITFDDGIDPVNTPKVLEVLKRYNAPATFFVIGERAESFPEILRQMVADGHRVGNHTFTHKPSFPVFSKERIGRELDSTDNIIARYAPGDKRYFRPPFGVTNPTIAGVVKNSGRHTIGWSIRSLDTMCQPQEKVLKRIISRLHPGAIILMHDDRDGIATLLEALLIHLRDNGYRVVHIEK